jgi:hypothetical protein
MELSSSKEQSMQDHASRPPLHAVPPALTIGKSLEELRLGLDALRKRERETGAKLDEEKKRVKKEIADLNKR